jgi:hypothetical protein
MSVWINVFASDSERDFFKIRNCGNLENALKFIQQQNE